MRVSEGEMKSAVAAHGNPGDGAMAAAGSDEIALLDKREKLLEEKILIVIVAVFGVDVETGAAVGSGDEEIGELMLLAHVFDEIPRAGMDEGLFVVAEAVKEIEDRKLARLVLVE